MSDLYPVLTGLPMTVWVSSKGYARHDARVKVCEIRGARMYPDRLAVMSVRPEPTLLHGDLSGEDVTAVTRWIRANSELLIEIWDGVVDPVSAFPRYRKA